jgi:hypothetical protein
MKPILIAAAIAAVAFSTAVGAAPPKRVAAPTTRFSIDTPLRLLIANPAARAALDRTMPGLSTNPNIGIFLNMSMKQLASSPHASIPASLVEKLQADLVKIR